MSKLATVFEEVTAALDHLAPMFKHHKLTFIARNTNPELDADVFISGDDIHKVIAALTELAEEGD